MTDAAPDVPSQPAPLRPEEAHDAERVLEWWQTAAQLPEADFLAGVLLLLRQAYNASLYEDFPDLHEKVASFLAGEPYCRTEPYFSIWEMGKLGTIELLAQESIDCGRYDECAERLSDFLRQYSARLERYRAQGVPVRRATQVRIAFLIVLARLKWVADPEYRDTVMSCEQLIDDALECGAHVDEFYANNPPDTNRASVNEALAILHGASLKLALRFCPERLPELVRGFNERFKETLSLEPLHCRTVDPRKGDRSAHYWEFELAKLRFEPAGTLDDLYQCIELRSLAARYSFVERPLSGVFINWRREALMLIREKKASLTGQAQQIG